MDILPMQERLLKNHSLAMEQSIMPAAMDDLLRKVSDLEGYMAVFNLESSVYALQNCVRFISELLLEQSIQSTQAGLEAVRATMSKIQSTVITVYELPAIPALSQALEEMLVHALKLSMPYIPEELEAECNAVITEKITTTGKKHISFGDLVAVVSLLVAIYFGIISSLPNEQLNRIIDINERMVDQQSVIIEQHKQEDLALHEALDALTASIGLLNDEIEALREQIQDIDDISNGDDKPVDNAGQAQNRYTKD